MSDGNSTAHGRSVCGRDDRQFFVANVALSWQVANRGSLESILLEESSGSTFADCYLEAAIAAHLHGRACVDLKELVIRRVSMSVAQLDVEVVGLFTLVVQDENHLRVAVRASCERDRVRIDVNGVTEGLGVLIVLAGKVTAEEVQLGKKLVKRCIFVVADLPKCLAVGVRLGAAV